MRHDKCHNDKLKINNNLYLERIFVYLLISPLFSIFFFRSEQAKSFSFYMNISLGWEIPFIVSLSNCSKNEKSSILQSNRLPINVNSRSFDKLHFGIPRVWSGASQKTGMAKRITSRWREIKETNEEINYLWNRVQIKRTNTKDYK